MAAKASRRTSVGPPEFNWAEKSGVTLFSPWTLNSGGPTDVRLDAFAATGAAPEQLGAAQASPQLLRCIHDLAARNEQLLRESDPFSGLIENTRLAHEVAVIHTYARQIVALLQQRDPLSERVHLSKAQFALYGLSSVLVTSLRRIGRARSASPSVRNRDA